MTSLGSLNPTTSGVSQGFGTNSNGSVIVGMSYYPFNGAPNYAYQAFRYSNGTMTGLGFLSGLSGAESVANGVSGNGSVVVGWSQSSNGAVTPGDRYEAFRWSGGTMSGLGYLPGGYRSIATGTNSDGSVVVGWGNSSSTSALEAFRWTAATGMVGLGFLPGGSFSQATATNADGSVVTGNADNEAFRWTAGTGMVGLTGLDKANAVDADGSIIVGESSALGAAIWTAGTGTESIQSLLLADGINNLVGWTLSDATGISADGTVIVGDGIDPQGNDEAWIADIPLVTAIGTSSTLTELTTRPSTGNIVYWSTLGTPTLEFTTPQSFTSTAGTTGTVNFNGTGTLLEQPIGINGTFDGDFAPGDLVITTASPLTISFNAPVQAAGAQIQDNTIGDHFTAEIQAFSGSTLLGSFTESGFSGSAGDNSDIFLGVQDTTADITSIVFQVFTGDPLVQTIVAINQLTILVEPSVTSILAHADNGATNLNAGHLVTITLTTSEAVTVTGTPTAKLNDGGTATYDAAATAALNDPTKLVFDYTVLSTDTNVPSLQVSSVNLNGATIRDGGGNNLNLSLSAVPTYSGPQIDTTIPAVTAVAEMPSTGSLTAGKNVTITLTTSEAVTVTGMPTLTLNDHGAATYSGISTDGKTLTFTYTVASTDIDVASLQVSSINLPTGATIRDGGGNNLDLTSLSAVPTYSGPAIDQDKVAEAPSLTTSGNVTVSAGGSKPLGISATPNDSDDTLSVQISNVPKFETITAPTGDVVTRNGNIYTITAPTGQAINNLMVHSSYNGKGHPQNTFNITATNLTVGETGTSASKSIIVTDPPTTAPDVTPPSLDHVVALFSQFAAGFSDQPQNGVLNTNQLSQVVTNQEQLLSNPHHG